MKKVAIVGMGYVGLPLGIRFAESGVTVVGIDVDPVKTVKLNRGESYIRHIEGSQLKPLVNQGVFSATTDFAVIESVEAVIRITSYNVCYTKLLRSRYNQFFADVNFKIFDKIRNNFV